MVGSDAIKKQSMVNVFLFFCPTKWCESPRAELGSQDEVFGFVEISWSGGA